ncbi:hypothetical protein GCM10011578_069430 [Streptomyces fuscichromogenes]|uniref:Uncharacterized protein n=1 Tax=Streptomyces fuscichromogenes TaxID=1324013 RepID=A0A918CV53_9ACTN|nr:hypothetical protein GCM10011578_069430 [Streptomyces fuscichromogenes]
MQHRPEAVAGTGEVVTGGRRHQTWVDPAEKDAEAGREHVRDETVAGGLQFRRREAAQRIAPGV